MDVSYGVPADKPDFRDVDRQLSINNTGLMQVAQQLLATVDNEIDTNQRGLDAVTSRMDKSIQGRLAVNTGRLLDVSKNLAAALDTQLAENNAQLATVAAVVPEMAQGTQFVSPLPRTGLPAQQSVTPQSSPSTGDISPGCVPLSLSDEAIYPALSSDDPTQNRSVWVWTYADGAAGYLTYQGASPVGLPGQVEFKGIANIQAGWDINPSVVGGPFTQLCQVNPPAPLPTPQPPVPIPPGPAPQPQPTPQPQPLPQPPAPAECICIRLPDDQLQQIIDALKRTATPSYTPEFDAITGELSVYKDKVVSFFGDDYKDLFDSDNAADFATAAYSLLPDVDPDSIPDGDLDSLDRDI